MFEVYGYTEDGEEYGCIATFATEAEAIHFADQWTMEGEVLGTNDTALVLEAH